MIRTPEQQYLHELIESYVAPLRSEIKELRKELAEQQVINLNMPVVMQRSEQLFAFLEYCDSAGWIKNVDKKRIIEDYEKANNCA
jgi:hypothetical protein